MRVFVETLPNTVEGAECGGMTDRNGREWGTGEVRFTRAELVDPATGAAFADRGVVTGDRALVRLRWDQSLELAGLDPFSASAVLAYAVRLVLAADLAKADADAGLERLRRTASPPVGGKAES